MHNINDVHFFNVIQILTGGNRNYISAYERRNIAGNEGQYIRPKWSSMSNVAQKHNQRLFCCMKTMSPYTKSRKSLKTNRRNFLGSICRIHGFNFMSRPFLNVIGIKRSLVMFCCPLKLCYICFICFYSSINHKSL